MGIERVSTEVEVRSRREGSVSTKLIFVQVAVVLVVMAVSGAVNYVQDSQRLNVSLRQRGEQLLKRLPPSLSSSLWNVDTTALDSAISMEMMDTDVKAIIVKSDSGTSGKIRDAKGEAAAWTEQEGQALPTSSFRHLSVDISY